MRCLARLRFFLKFEYLSFRELEDKSEQLLRVKREKATVLADLEAKLAAREREVHPPSPPPSIPPSPSSLQVAHTTRELEAVSVSKKELDGKAEGYLKKLRDSREEQASVEEQLRKELTSQVSDVIMMSLLNCQSHTYTIKKKLF